MNWDAIGAVGEVVGAAAVIASLVYPSIQIRQFLSVVLTIAVAVPNFVVVLIAPSRE